MKFRNVLHLYRVRLRARVLQECFAVVGIAAGVALLFASQVASQSLSSSVAQLSRGIVGDATLQLLARDTGGFDEHLLVRVRQIPGVRVAAPLLEANANAIGPRGSRSVELIGADASLRQLGGTLVAHTKLEPFGGIGAIALPAPLARSLDVRKFGAELTLQIAGHTSQAPLYTQLSTRQIGALVDTPIVLAPLTYAEEMAGLKGHVTRVLVSSAPGKEAAVRRALRRIAGGRLDVETTSYDERLFAKAAQASNQSTVLFAVISALVGFLFAFNAMLLTMPQRRRLIADLRRDGYTPRAVIGVLMLDALALGALACLLGLALGEALSVQLFHSNPGYLSSAFAVGSARVVSAKSILVAAGGGMLAALAAVLSPLRDVLSRNPLAAIAAKEHGARTTGARRRVAVGLACLGLSVATLIFAPAQAILGMVSLIVALLLLLALALEVLLALVKCLAPAVTSAIPHLAVMELRTSRSRAVAIAATGAIAVFGSVSIQGAHGDLQHGLENAAHDMNAFTDIWVAPAGTFNLLMAQPFPAQKLDALRGLPGIRAVRVYRGGLLDWGQRRIWVIAPPRVASPLTPPSQLLEGNLRVADERLRGGGWAVASLALAREHHLHIGRAFLLPAPHPSWFRLAAISTNIGWAPGALILNADDYRRAWGSDQPSAYNVLLSNQVAPVLARREIEQVLGPGSGLLVQSAKQHADRQRALTREGLARLTQIASMVLIVAVLAMSAAIGAMIWQRRPRLAKLKLEGFSRADLWCTVLLESLLLLTVGCATGAIAGLLGQQLLDRALSLIVNYPVVASLAFSALIETFVFVVAAAILVLALPGYLAVRVPASLALSD